MDRHFLDSDPIRMEQADLDELANDLRYPYVPSPQAQQFEAGPQFSSQPVLLAALLSHAQLEQHGLNPNEVQFVWIDGEQHLIGHGAGDEQQPGQQGPGVQAGTGEQHESAEQQQQPGQQPGENVQQERADQPQLMEEADEAPTNAIPMQAAGVKQQNDLLDIPYKEVELRNLNVAKGRHTSGLHQKNTISFKPIGTEANKFVLQGANLAYASGEINQNLAKRRSVKRAAQGPINGAGE